MSGSDAFFGYSALRNAPQDSSHLTLIALWSVSILSLPAICSIAFGSAIVLELLYAHCGSGWPCSQRVGEIGWRCRHFRGADIHYAWTPEFRLGFHAARRHGQPARAVTGLTRPPLMNAILVGPVSSNGGIRIRTRPSFNQSSWISSAYHRETAGNDCRTCP